MMIRVIPLLLFAALAWGGEVKQEDRWKHIAERFAPTELKADLTALSPREKQALFNFVQAARAVDAIFWDQGGPYLAELRKQIETSGPDDLKLAFAINYGPYDEQEEEAPFYGDRPRLPGASFYPADMTKDEFNTYVAAHADKKTSLESPYTVVVREGKELKALTYHEAHREKVEQAAAALERASSFIDDPLLVTYVRQRAADLRTDDYYKSDCDWIDLKDNRIEIVIGPYEVYEDHLLGLKAAYEAYVYVVDHDASAKLSTFVENLPYLQSTLPMPSDVRQARPGLESPLRVVNLVYSAGDARQGVQTVAFNLPNDERVREEKGSKKVILKNLLQAKFEKILVPMARAIFGMDGASLVRVEPFLNSILLHEISHALGVTTIRKPDGSLSNPNLELRELYSAIEEAKADVLGLFSASKLMEKKVLPASDEQSYYATFVASIFRSIRFGVAEAHGKANILQLNYFAKEGGIAFDPVTGLWRIDVEKIKKANARLAAELLRIQYQGDYEGAKKLLEEEGAIPPQVQQAIAACSAIPVDIRPIFMYDEKTK